MSWSLCFLAAESISRGRFFVSEANSFIICGEGVFCRRESNSQWIFEFDSSGITCLKAARGCIKREDGVAVPSIGIALEFGACMEWISNCVRDKPLGTSRTLFETDDDRAYVAG